MPGPRRFLLLLFLLLAGGLTAFFVLRATGSQEVGPAVALCPGPDGYGYRCTGERPYDYVDATMDTELYEDDALILLNLPFDFTFYGVQYDQVWASSNGNLQFGSGDSGYNNVCLAPEPAAGMGNMAAPYWDDLTLVFEGFLETAVVGQAPERIFVVEWQDVPKFGTLDDRVTFEVQLFEGSNDIVFLYQDTQTLEGANGSQATIGLQSEDQGYALQLSCNQIAVYNGSAVHFVHPQEPAVGAAGGGVSHGSVVVAAASAKGPVADLLETLNSQGRAGLANLQREWMGRRPALASDWRWADVEGDGQDELVMLWRGGATRPELVEMAVVGLGDDGRWQARWQRWPLARQEQLRGLALVANGDVTGDGRQEVILGDPLGGGLTALMSRADGYEVVGLPGRCRGPVVLRDVAGDSALEIIRGGCPGGERQIVHWDGQAFAISDGR